MIRFFKSINTHSLVVALVAIASVLTLGVGATVSAHGWHRGPDYVKITKPTSSSICEGGEWVTVNGSWWHHHHGSKKVWVPNWEKQGFESHAQCVKYTTTAAPTSKADCKQNWEELGFASKQDCKRYLRIHQGGGYGGGYGGGHHHDGDDDHDSDDD
jgi:hypothetical protein